MPNRCKPSDRPPPRHTAEKRRFRQSGSDKGSGRGPCFGRSGRSATRVRETKSLLAGFRAPRFRTERLRCRPRWLPKRPFRKLRRYRCGTRISSRSRPPRRCASKAWIRLSGSFRPSPRKHTLRPPVPATPATGQAAKRRAVATPARLCASVRCPCRRNFRPQA